MEVRIIKDFYGRKLGTIETDPQGTEVAKDFYGRVLGRYNKALDVTTDFYGRRISKGNVVASFIFNKGNMPN